MGGSETNTFNDFNLNIWPKTEPGKYDTASTYEQCGPPIGLLAEEAVFWFLSSLLLQT